MPDKNVIQRNLDAEVSDVETKVDTLLARLTALRAGYLDELAAANLPADVDTLLTRLSAVRAGYLDELAAANIPADIDAILTDTGTTLPGEHSDIETKVDTAITDIGTVDTVVDTNQDFLDGTTATPTAYRREYGVRQVKEISVTSAANAGDVVLATVTDQPCVIEQVIIHADTASQTDLTSTAIYGGAAKVITFIDTTDGAKANIDAVDEQVAWVGAVRLAATKTIVITLTGTGATNVDLTVIITYYACVDGGYLT